MDTKTIYGRFNPPPKVVLEFGRYDRNGVWVPDKSRTKQEFVSECDINKIVARAVRTGVMPMTVPAGRYGDFSDVGDYQEAQQRLKVAEAQFMALPSGLRAKLGHDPAKFLEWISDKANLEEANSFGLLNEEARKRLVDEKAKPSGGEPPK